MGQNAKDSERADDFRIAPMNGQVPRGDIARLLEMKESAN
jgi:hypothetical protein